MLGVLFFAILQAMNRIILCTLLMCSWVVRLEAQNESDTLCQPYCGVVRIVRFATELHFMPDSRAEFAVNALFEVDGGIGALKISHLVPSARHTTVKKFQYQIFSPSGKLIKNWRVRRASYDAVKDFMPIATAAEYFLGFDVMRFELDFRVVLEEMQGYYQWHKPGVAEASDVSLRLMWDDEGLFDLDTNIKYMAKKGVFDGAEFLLWHMTNLTPQGGEFVDGFIKAPFVRVSQKSSPTSEQ